MGSGAKPKKLGIFQNFCVCKVSFDLGEQGVLVAPQSDIAR